MIRKLYGYTPIPQRYATDFTELDSQQVCRYVTTTGPATCPPQSPMRKGKQRKQYRYQDMVTAYEKFRPLAKPSQCLKPGITFKNLHACAHEMTDNEAAEQLHSARDHLCKQFHERLKIRA